MNRLRKPSGRLGRILLDNALLILPVLFLIMPVAAYLQYGLGKEFYRVLVFMMPAIALVSYFMIRFHVEYREAYKDNSGLVARLQREGCRVMARVVDVTQSNAFINEMPVMRITIEYNANGKQYTKTVARVVAYDSLHVLTAGATRWVLVDKADPRVVVLP